MARLGKSDLEQMGEDYFRRLEPERLVEVVKNLHELAVEQLEELEATSKTSSRPPSSDVIKGKSRPIAPPEEVPLPPEAEKEPERDSEAVKEEKEESVSQTSKEKPKGFGEPKRKAGK